MHFWHYWNHLRQYTYTKWRQTSYLVGRVVQVKFLLLTLKNKSLIRFGAFIWWVMRIACLSLWLCFNDKNTEWFIFFNEHSVELFFLKDAERRIRIWWNISLFHTAQISFVSLFLYIFFHEILNFLYCSLRQMTQKICTVSATLEYRTEIDFV